VDTVRFSSDLPFGNSGVRDGFLGGIDMFNIAFSALLALFNLLNC
jgi:hypothetical protein